MNPILQTLSHRIAVKSAAENLRILKTSPTTMSTAPNITALTNANLIETNRALKTDIQGYQAEVASLRDRLEKAQAERDQSAGLKAHSPAAQVAKVAPSPAAASVAQRLAKQAPAATRPTATAPKPAAPAAPAPKLTTAAEFSSPELRMSRAEFSKLFASDKSRFATSGGRLV